MHPVYCSLTLLLASKLHEQLALASAVPIPSPKVLPVYNSTLAPPSHSNMQVSPFPTYLIARYNRLPNRTSVISAVW